jgi:cyclopropane fatty-acyl-phospholipid synthase-like methyltransferase
VIGRPGVLEVTGKVVDAGGFSDRLTLLPGDYLTTPFGSMFDAALLTGMMNRETPENVNLLLKKAFTALEPGGLVMVSDVFFDDDRMNTPPFATSFALNMMLTSDHGSAHAKTAMERWMADNGFRNITRHDMPKPNPHTLILGTRP